MGDVDGRVCVLIDDMIDTGGTIVGAAELLAEKGAKEVLPVPPTEYSQTPRLKEFKTCHKGSGDDQHPSTSRT